MPKKISRQKHLTTRTSRAKASSKCRSTRTSRGGESSIYRRYIKGEWALNLNDLAASVHRANIKWWEDLRTGMPIKRNKGELIALMHSELSEALEGERKDLMDDHLPHRKMAEVELVDCIIRILDYAAGFGYDLQGAFVEKMIYNATRADHKHEARRIAGGKQF